MVAGSRNFIEDLIEYNVDIASWLEGFLVGWIVSILSGMEENGKKLLFVADVIIGDYNIYYIVIYRVLSLLFCKPLFLCMMASYSKKSFFNCNYI